jgi:hypothetical protein
MLGVVRTPGRRVVLGPEGVRLVQAGAEERQAIWRAWLLGLGWQESHSRKGMNIQLRRM